jgi:hypothetical protein
MQNKGIFLPRKCMHKDDIFSILLFITLSLVINICLILTQNLILMAIHVSLTH